MSGNLDERQPQPDIHQSSIFDGLREQVLQMKDRADYEFNDEDTRLAAKAAYGNVLMAIDDIILGKSRG